MLILNAHEKEKIPKGFNEAQDSWRSYLHTFMPLYPIPPPPTPQLPVQRRSPLASRFMRYSGVEGSGRRGGPMTCAAAGIVMRMNMHEDTCARVSFKSGPQAIGSNTRQGISSRTCRVMPASVPVLCTINPEPGGNRLAKNDAALRREKHAMY